MNVRLPIESRRTFACVLAAACCLPVSESKSDEPDKGTKPAADLVRGKKAGEVRDDNGLKMKLLWCPAGSFVKETKSVADRPPGGDQVEVTLTRGIWLGKYEVTQGEWKQVMRTEPWTDKDLVEETADDFPKAGADFPATFVSWNDAVAFGRKLTELERQAGRLPDGWEYTLPTAAEWESACRAGTKARFSFGDDESQLGEYAWYGHNAASAGEFSPHPVGQKRPNAWGLHDMHGNVSEWCRDWYRDELPGGRDPEVKTRPGQYDCHVLRGGNWGGTANSCRSSNHWGEAQASRSSRSGFRVALSPAREARPPDPRAESPSTTDK